MSFRLSLTIVMCFRQRYSLAQISDPLLLNLPGYTPVRLYTSPLSSGNIQTDTWLQYRPYLFFLQTDPYAWPHWCQPSPRGPSQGSYSDGELCGGEWRCPTKEVLPFRDWNDPNGNYLFWGREHRKCLYIVQQIHHVRNVCCSVVMWGCYSEKSINYFALQTSWVTWGCVLFWLNYLFVVWFKCPRSLSSALVPGS